MDEVDGNPIEPMHGSSYALADPNQNTVQPDITAIDNQRIIPRQLSSGALRGTQHVGYGDVKIDGSNNQIVIGNVTDSLGQQALTVIGDLTPTNSIDKSFGLKVIDEKGGQLLIGRLSDGNLGIEIFDASGNVMMRAGFLPITQIYGWATATPGNTLEGQV